MTKFRSCVHQIDIMLSDFTINLLDKYVQNYHQH